MMSQMTPEHDTATLNDKEIEYYIQRGRQLRAEAMAAMWRSAWQRMAGLWRSRPHPMRSGQSGSVAT